MTGASYERCFDLWRQWSDDEFARFNIGSPMNVRQIRTFLREEARLIQAGQVEPSVYVVRKAAS